MKPKWADPIPEKYAAIASYFMDKFMGHPEAIITVESSVNDFDGVDTDEVLSMMKESGVDISDIEGLNLLRIFTRVDEFMQHRKSTEIVLLEVR